MAVFLYYFLKFCFPLSDLPVMPETSSIGKLYFWKPPQKIDF